MLNAYAASNSAVSALRPQVITGSSLVAGLTIDKRALVGGPFQYGKLVFQTGAKGGTASPTSLTMTAKFQHSDDDSTYTDLTDTQIVNATSAVLTDENKVGSLDINLNGTKRYVRAAFTPAFTGGTAPSVLLSASLALGEPRII